MRRSSRERTGLAVGTLVVVVLRGGAAGAGSKRSRRFCEQLGDRSLLTLVSDGEVGAHVALDE